MHRLLDDEQLQQLVKCFYRTKFWDCYRADDIPSQAIAEELYDTGVNLGQSRAAKYLQRAINLVIDAQLKIDGIIGPNTLGDLGVALRRLGNEEVILKTQNVLQGIHYVGQAEDHRSQRVFYRGWVLRRVGL